METKAELLEGDRAKVTVTIDAATVSNRIKAQYKDFAGRGLKTYGISRR